MVLGNIDWIILVQNWNQLGALVNTVMNLRVPYITEKLLSSCKITSTRDGLSYLQSVCDQGADGAGPKHVQ
jgi:hypothetical protein